MAYLYDQGFPPIGHIQSGNIFVRVLNNKVDSVKRAEPEGGEGQIQNVSEAALKDAASNDMGNEAEAKSVSIDKDNSMIFCRVGGYENTLLGYKTRLFGSLGRGDMDRIDIVLFGHVVYEMACGRELSGAFPGVGDYDAIENDEIRAALKKIFGLRVLNNHHKNAIAEVSGQNTGYVYDGALFSWY